MGSKKLKRPMVPPPGMVLVEPQPAEMPPLSSDKRKRSGKPRPAKKAGPAPEPTSGQAPPRTQRSALFEVFLSEVKKDVDRNPAIAVSIAQQWKDCGDHLEHHEHGRDAIKFMDPQMATDFARAGKEDRERTRMRIYLDGTASDDEAQDFPERYKRRKAEEQPFEALFSQMPLVERYDADDWVWDGPTGKLRSALHDASKPDRAEALSVAFTEADREAQCLWKASKVWETRLAALAADKLQQAAAEMRRMETMLVNRNRLRLDYHSQATLPGSQEDGGVGADGADDALPTPAPSLLAHATVEEVEEEPELSSDDVIYEPDQGADEDEATSSADDDSSDDEESADEVSAEEISEASDDS